MKLKINNKMLLIFGCSFLSWLSLLSTSSAQIQPNYHKEEIVFIPAKERQAPPNRGTPESDYGAGSRGSCPYRQEMSPLSSLVGNNKALSSTVDRHPSFWVYIPYTTQEVTRGIFSLQDGDNDVYRTEVSLPKNLPGIVEIELPETSQPLKVGKEYRWYFELDCSEKTKPVSNKPPSFATITGTVCLIEPPKQFEQELSSATNYIMRAKVFAKYGVWHDTVTQLIRLRSQEPNNSSYEKLWQNLLLQPEVDRAQMIDKPFVGKANAMTLN